MRFKKTKLAAFGIFTLLILLYLFVQSPNLNPLYVEGALFWCVVVTAYLGIWAIFRFGELSLKLDSTNIGGPAVFNYVPNKKFPIWTKIVLIVPWAFLLIVMVASSFIFNWKAFRGQLGESENNIFSSDIQVVDVKQLPIVDKDLAYNLADKKLGERLSLGSQVVKGEPVIQRVDGKLVWVVPLHHSGFFKWLTNMSGTPGYIVVSATDVNDVTYVDGYKIKYQPGLYLLDNLQRHIRLSGYWFTGITDYSFELDDTGTPFWVVSTYRNLRGFSLPEATGIILVNAATGETTKHSKDQIPEWIDRVQPEEFIIQQIQNQGEFVHGFLNFSDKDKYQPSKGHSIVYNNGRCYLFTGLTSVGSDESAIGFIMVDMVTKQSFRYQMSGATEYSGQKSAEGKVQHLSYYASFPIIINVDGQPTYFMTLKDRENLIKQYAFVSVVNYSTVGTGETIDSAIVDYKRSMSSSGIGTIDQNGELKTISATVKRIASDVVNGETLYKILLDGYPEIVFTSQSTLSEFLPLTVVGDKVTLSYVESASLVCAITEFKNDSL